MPLTINVGLNRKTSANYNSAGTSINLTAELDPSLLTRPHELQAEIDRLYAQAETALHRQAQRDRDALGVVDTGSSNGHHRHGRPATDAPPVTASQMRTIAMLGPDIADTEARALFQRELHQLTRPEASRLIDHLKRLTRPCRQQ